MTMPTDQLGRPLVFVQTIDHSVDGRSYEVVDRRMPTGQKIVGVFTNEKKARADAKRRGSA